MTEAINKEPKEAISVDPKPQNSQEAFLKTVRDRLDRSIAAEKDERKKGNDDVKFINGDQWESGVKEQRGKGRLCLTINKMPTSLDQIDGDIRLNTPGIKVTAVDDGADTDTADVIEGLIRYIQRNSRAQKVHSYAGLHAAAGGRGAWRIVTDYVSDISFKQEITIKRIVDSYSVYFDPDAEQDDKQDGMYFFLASTMSKDAFREKYGHEPVDFEADGKEFANWVKDDDCIIAEYFYKEKESEKTIYMLDDGSVVDDQELGGWNTADFNIVKKRKVPVYKIKWAKVDGKHVLETGVIPGRMFPIVLTWGKQLCVDGKLETRGIARHAKDAQRLYNYFRSNDAESAALQPKQPFLMPDKCLTDDFKKVWDKANDENYPYLPYKVDPQNPGLSPRRESPAMASSGNREQVMISDTEMRDTIGIQKAALGIESNEKSGVAIQKRKQESDTGQFAFIDNLGDAIVTEGKILLGMIPEIYDYEDQIRILGKDMKEKVVTINQEGGIDFTMGRYDVDISMDGSYSTQREEFQEKVTNILPQLPEQQRAAISDLLFEMQDFHRADDIAQRLKKLIPPELLENEDDLNEELPPGQDMQQEELIPQDQPVDPAMEAAAQAEQMAMQAQAQAQDIELQTAQVKLEQELEKLELMKAKTANEKQLAKENIADFVRQMMAEGTVEI